MPASQSKILFQTNSNESVLKIELLLSAAGNKYDRVNISVEGSTPGNKEYPLVEPLALAESDKQFAIKLDLNKSPSAFIDHGLLGFRPDSASAELAAVRIVIRPCDRDNAHSTEHPYFALYLDWQIKATTSRETQFSNNANVGIGAAVELILSTGFSSIFPFKIDNDLGSRAIQLRMDLEFIAATTGWFPLSLVDYGGFPSDTSGLRDWFSLLAGIDFKPRLPDWSLDLRLPVSLPLGLKFKHSFLTLTKGKSGHIIEAKAKGLLLNWEGNENFEYAYETAEFSLTYSNGKYTYQSVLFAAQIPSANSIVDEKKRIVSLPFGSLELHAKAIRITAGLFGSGTPFKVCPELVIELAEVELRSSLANDELWNTEAMRLHLRGMSLLVCEVSGGKVLFEGLDANDNCLGKYRDIHNPRVPTLSGIALEPDPDAESTTSAFSFIDGDFDSNGYLYLLWQQDNDRLFDKLVGVIPGLSKSKSAEPRKSFFVALEATRFMVPGGADHQVRLEWREVAAPATSLNTPADANELIPAPVCAERQPDGSWVLTLPQGKPVPQPVKKAAFRLDLPLLEASVAEPDASALLFYGTADKSKCISLLHLYAANEPVMQAKFDLNIESSEGRQALPTKPKSGDSRPFIEMRLGSGETQQALAVVSWMQGDTPRLMRAYQGSGQPFEPLLPANPSGVTPPDCSGCPTSPQPRRAPPMLPPSRFGTPDPLAESNGWSLSIIASAQRALTSFVSELGGDSLVSFTIDAICYDSQKKPSSALLPPLRINTTLEVKISAFAGRNAGAVKGKAVFAFDPGELSLRLVEGGVFEFSGSTVEPPGWVRILGYPEEKKLAFFNPIPLFGKEFKAHFYRTGVEPGQEYSYLVLDLRDGRIQLTMAEGTRCILRYDLGEDALHFDVEQFTLGSGGLDTQAKLIPSPLKLRGLQNTFQLENAELTIKANRLRRLSIGGNGKLPEILSNAPVGVNLTLKQEQVGGPIELEELACWLKSADEPIYSTGLRYRFEISELSMRYLNEGGKPDNRQFFFEVTGSAQFEPEKGEFAGGMLENLKSARIEFTRAPLSDEFADHLEFLVELNKPVTFEIFNVFRMEIRSFGFAPKHDFPDGTPRPALIIGGQCEFADSGDVISAEVDFHRMYLGLPPPSESLPQVQFDGLRVEIRAADGFRIGGAVRVYDGAELKGFKGDGFVQLPGFPHLGAAFAFMQIRDPDSGTWQRGWFLALEASAVSYQLAPLPVYLRQVGYGFGYRMTSVLLRNRPEDEELHEFVAFMMTAMNEHQTVARIESWVEDIESDWTVALEAVFTLGTTQGDPFDYRAKNERELRTIVFQVLAAMNNNGLVAATKLWFPVSYDDFLNNRSDMRKRPLAKGFTHFSPRSQRLLTYASKEKNAYYGPERDTLTELVRSVLEPVPFEAAALIEPSRLRGELGWADRLVFPLNLGPLNAECRGGILFAIERNSAVFGLYFAARGELGLSGKAGGGSLGLRVSAHALVHFATRLMLVQPLLKPLGGTVYAQVGIDINVRFAVQAWFKFKVGFVKVKLSVSFSISLQVLVALEIGLANGTSLGCKGRAIVAIRVFGRRLSASIAVGVNESGVNAARKRVAPYMSSMLEPGKIPPVPGKIVARTKSLRAPAALLSVASSESVLSTKVPTISQNHKKTKPIPEPYVMAVVPVGDKQWLLWILPTARKPNDDIKGFYPLPPKPKDDDNGWTKWATLSEIPNGTNIFALSKCRKFEVTPEEGTLDLICHAEKSFKVEHEEPSSGSSPTLTFRQAVASGYVPVGKADTDAFPFDFDGGIENLEPPEPELDKLEILQDERVHEGPRHADPVLNPEHKYDAALASAIESNVDGHDQSAHQKAHGNQSFLLAAFREDLASYAAAHEANEKLNPDAFASDAPGLWDSGMVLLIKEELPEWVKSRDRKIDRPKIKFFEEEAFPLFPVVEPEMAQFSNGRVRLAEPPVVHFDEELLALSWKMAWQGEPPEAADGIGTSVEDFLSHYRVELYDLTDGSRPIVRKEVRPANLVVNMPKEGQSKTIIELQPRYSFTIPVTELFSNNKASEQVERLILAVVTPVAEAGEEGEPFTITAKQEPRLTPLPADKPEYTLQKDSAMVSWREPALPNMGGIARTDYWEIVLRRLPHVPLGQYPEAAGANAAANDAIGSKLNLQPGDLIVRMSKDNISHGAWHDIEDNIPEMFREILKPVEGEEREDNDGSEKFYLQLPNDLFKKEADWFDYTGRKIADEGKDTDFTHQHLRTLRESFRQRVSAALKNGHAWQLYLRSRNSSGTTSSLIKIRGNARTFDKEAKKWTNIPLFHFEWPELLQKPILPKPRVTAGPLHVPFADIQNTKFSLDEDSTDEIEGAVAYRAAHDESRVVSTRWLGFAGQAFALAAMAGFELREIREDGLTNKDIAERKDSPSEATAKVIAGFETVDPEIAAAAPDSFAETQLWQSWGPAQRSIFDYLDEPDRNGLPRPASSFARDSWFSSVDSDLEWPPLESDALTISQLELGEAKPTERSNLHPFLLEILIRLQRNLRDDRLEVKVAMGVPDVKASSQLEWLGRNTERLDPYGWAALWHLGLAVEITVLNSESGIAERQLDVVKRLGSVISEIFEDNDVKIAFSKHLALDLPLHGNAGIAASDEKIPLADVALDRVQLALRPVPVVREHYLEVEVPPIEPDSEKVRILPEQETLEKPDKDGFFWKVLNGPSDIIGYANSKKDLAEIFISGRKILVKALPDTIDNKIKSFLEDVEGAQIIDIKCPFSLLDEKSTDNELPLTKPLERKASIWPHGQFNVAIPKPENPQEPKDPNDPKDPEGGFAAFADYLVNAPVTPQPGESERNDESPKLTGKDLPQREKIKELYNNWSERFFASAPISHKDSQDIFSRENISTVVPRSDSVDMLSPGLDGSYCFNRRVNWQWATTRSIEVAAVGRYDRFLASLDTTQKVSPDNRATSGLTAFYLPRIRKLESPQILGERVVENTAASDDAMVEGQFHEITIAMHEEERLQSANSAMQRKLEFAGTQMRFRRKFLYSGWVSRLGELLHQTPEFEAPKLNWQKVPEFSGSTGSYLRWLPEARLGATILLTPAEPFFYASTLEIGASALQVKSAMQSVVLTVPEPDECKPEPSSKGNAQVVKVKPEVWQAPFDARKQAWEDAWKNEHENWNDSLSRSTLVIAARYPRLFESLAGCRRKVEQEGRAFGNLPDPNITLQFDAHIDGASTPLFSLHPNYSFKAPNKRNESQPFLMNQISNEFMGSLLHIESRPDWMSGLWLKTSLRPNVDKVSVVHQMSAALVANEPLARTNVEELFKSANLPAWGRLAALAPIALRLDLKENKLNFHNPCRLAARNVMPLTGQELDPEPAVADITIALRLLLDSERMGAAKAAAYEAEAPQPLLRLIETAAGAACRRVPSGEIPQADWQAILNQLKVWGKRNGDEPVWSLLESPPSDDVTLVIAIAPGWTPPVENAFEQFQQLTAPDGITQRKLEKIKQVETAAKKLATKLEAPLQAARKFPEPKDINVWTQRGNERRAFWGGCE